jgi:hypothetical protein
MTKKNYTPEEIKGFFEYLLTPIKRLSPQWAELNKKTDRIEPSRKGGGLGWYMAIWVKPISLLKEDSYYRDLLKTLDYQGATSDDVTQRFDMLYGPKYNRRKTQGSVSNYLDRLLMYGLADHVGEKWFLAPGVDVNDGPALFAGAMARAKALQARAQKQG